MAEHTRLEPGKKAPAFTLSDDTGAKVKLTDLLANAGPDGHVVLYFYPAAMTPGCTTQACDFRDNLKVFNKAGITIVGISPDAPEKLAKFRAKEKLTFPLLSDPDKTVLEKYGAYGEKKLYGKTVTGVIRSTIVLDAKGKVVEALYNVKATGHVAKLLRGLDLA